MMTEFQANSVALHAGLTCITMHCHCLCLCGFVSDQLEKKEQSSLDYSEGADQIFQGMPLAETEHIHSMVQESAHEV